MRFHEILSVTGNGLRVTEVQHIGALYDWTGRLCVCKEEKHFHIPVSLTRVLREQILRPHSAAL